MQLGIFARTFQRASMDEVLAAIAACGLRTMQFNFACAGLPTVPKEIPDAVVVQVRAACHKHGIEMAAISGTFNAIHPDRRVREEGVGGCIALIRACRSLGTTFVTLCTGTRDASDMWTTHPDNPGAAAWGDLLATMSRLVPEAEAASVCLGIEPEPANVICSAHRARKLIDELRSPAIKIIFDPANLVAGSCADAGDMTRIITQAADLLGPEISLVHAKELTDAPLEVDFDLVFRVLRERAFDGPVILHNLDEEQVPARVRYIRAVAKRWYSHIN